MAISITEGGGEPDICVKKGGPYLTATTDIATWDEDGLNKVFNPGGQAKASI